MVTAWLIIQILAGIACSIAAIGSILLFMQLKWPALYTCALKVLVSALSPVFFLTGLCCLAAGIAASSLFLIFTGAYTSLVYLQHIYFVKRPPDPTTGFGQAFGADWQKRFPPAKKKYFLPRRTAFFLPAVPQPRTETDILYASLPGNDRQLLCDIWRPAEHIPVSGLALLYFHGSAWYLLNKGFGTSTLFKQLAAQGHVIMDVGYRVWPDTDMMGMIGDAKRAVAWLKEEAGNYGVNPNKIVMMGGSSGGHLALLAAYTAGDPSFTPPDLAGKDTHVCAVISAFGPTDLEALYHHMNRHSGTGSLAGQSKQKVRVTIPAWLKNKLGAEYYRLRLDKGFENVGDLAAILGGRPDEQPGIYRLFSPVTHVHAGCPPTLIIQNKQDMITPVGSTRSFYQKLKAEKVRVVMHELSQTDHAFLLVLPGISPASHNAFYDVEQFLALMV